MVDSDVNSPNDIDQHADRFLGHYRGLAGRVRTTLVHEQISLALGGPASAIDLGCGDGQQSIKLLMDGHSVTLVDSSAKMLDEAARRIGELPRDVRRRATFVDGNILGISKELKDSYDLVMCHGVFMYYEDPGPLLRECERLSHSTSVISILTKSALALAMRPALRSEYRKARGLFGMSASIGWLGELTFGVVPDEFRSCLASIGFGAVEQFGVCVLSDHLLEEREVLSLSDQDFDDFLECERLAGSNSPYREVAHLVHFLAKASS